MGIQYTLSIYSNLIKVDLALNNLNKTIPRVGLKNW